MIIKILHTNDLHSNFHNFFKIANKIKKLKDENTLVLDAGDFADFKSIELQGTDGLAAVELLESAEYDAITVGNNETFNGVDILENMASNSKIPFLSCNINKLDGSVIEGVKKSIIIAKANKRFLILGGSPDLDPFNELNGIKLVEYRKALREELECNKGSYDYCILLSHFGMTSDNIIAGEFQEINIIIGGHSHILMKEPTVIQNTLIHTSGCYGEYLGYLEIELEDSDVRLISGQNIKTEKKDENLFQLEEVLRRNKIKAVERLSKPLYKIKENLWHDIIEENPISNLLADAIRDFYKADLGIINSGVLNGGVKKGTVSKKKLLDICPSPLNPTCLEIQGKDIMESLQKSLDSEVCLSAGIGPGFRGKYLGRLHVSNAVIEHDGNNILKVLISGKNLEESKWYTVATSDYLHRGTGYTNLKNNRNEKYHEDYLRDTLRRYLDKEEFVKKSLVERWIFKD
ncbi:MAG: bifunctional metallophosphatase/5'-nucleotidase [Clostridiaceae bacterium]|nr:bifunctional metallophosphatase/5'-nucleotidase [Clostridiaceae bacterium]